MATIDSEILNIKDTIISTVDPDRVYLFGSYAYGTPKSDSDYDFYVVLKDTSSLKPLEAMGLLVHHINVGMPVDVLANYKTRFDERSRFPTLERTIHRQGVLLYEAK
jgi:predicted nucleotidyltransferase